MNLERRINAFAQLGCFFSQVTNYNNEFKHASLGLKDKLSFIELVKKQKINNGWFTEDNVLNAVKAWSKELTKDKLNKWVVNYNFSNKKHTIAVIMAGNVPMVGFHDALCVLLSGNILQAKLSSNDNDLIKTTLELLIKIEPDFKEDVQFVDKLSDFDAVIATGSDNSARYFEYYFGKRPHIIRKNRVSVGIINEHDTEDELSLLGDDIFTYFGLGCRNISKLFIPEKFDFDLFFKSIYDKYQTIIYNNKYANNYDYNKAIYLMGQHKFYDNGFVLVKEDKGLVSPVSVLYYHYYQSEKEVEDWLAQNDEKIQCVTSSENCSLKTLNFGQAQQPQLSDYADGVDTLAFITSF